MLLLQLSCRRSFHPQGYWCFFYRNRCTAYPPGTEGSKLAAKQSIQVLKLLTMQGPLDEIDLSPLLSEVTFLAQAYGRSGVVEDELGCSTALHLAVYFGLENVATVLLIQARTALHLESGPGHCKLAPLHTACDLGRRNMVELLLRHGASVN